MLNLTYRYRIYPGLDQEAQMLDWLEQCRRVYNYALAERKDWSNSRKCPVNACSIKQEYIIPAETPYPDYYKQQNALTKAKEEIPELKAVHSQVLQDALKRLDKAFKFRQERGFGFPRFKKFGQYRSFVFPQFKSNPVNGFEIKLPKIGAMPINLHRPIPEGFEVKQVRVVFKSSGWYAQLILQAHISIPDVMPHGEPIGIDLGLEKFLATSTGELIERPRFFVDLQSKLKWLQRKLRNKKKGSANYRKIQAKIRKLHEHIHNVRREFHFLTAHKLCDAAGMLFAEDLNLKMTSRGMLAKHCLDAAWGSFLDILKWVSWKRGVYFAKVDPNGTSQTCPQCGAHTGKKELSERVHHCDECGYVAARDVAAAQVVMQRGLVLVADGQSVKLPVEEDCLGVPMKQETSRAILGRPHRNL
ncbi:RNA-guided endonuclease TnpB family protein [Synechocystis sp. PCC 7338]|uniref:RNA-guided endonuclease InsQ/TnpB family protein n=1 Tax=Synechocystis sp. PCC 7338 TaxID=2732530 RepID=UPI001BAE6AAD|nr:RNA-guided endonuclease TnpB family protein [Synechocystis sp. PCC 7338]QUS59899.1 transposase [Synechocystis sp. PCC 7338]